MIYLTFFITDSKLCFLFQPSARNIMLQPTAVERGAEPFHRQTILTISGKSWRHENVQYHAIRTSMRNDAKKQLSYIVTNVNVPNDRRSTSSTDKIL